MEIIKNLLSFKDLRKKILYTLFIIFIYRLGTHIPIAGVNIEAIKNIFSGDGLLGFVNLFSGGALSRYSILGLGILPYINASIIMQLITVIYPKLKEMLEEGDVGRKKLAQYTRYLAIILAAFQSVFMAIGFRNFINADINFYVFLIYSIIILVTGTALVMWFGELITEFGIGNGASILIFVGIIAQMPMYISNTIILIQGGTNIFRVILLIAVILFIIVSIVFIQEGERKIPVQYAKKIVGRKMYGGQNTYIPLRLIQGGVLPIIFASAILQFPLMFAQYIPINFIQNFLSVYYRYDGFLYSSFFCFLIFFFTYFYTAITFNPSELAENIKKYGGFILGVRPGKPTEIYLEKIISKLTLVGATFLAFIALVPNIAANITNVTSFMGLGGTALLIIVGVAMDLVKQIDIYLINRKYEKVI
ncbi:MAG: preprotein translocase subunit SecY [Salinivirgaceae bacterium]|nr:preprotein translocase subunit SecY [Salinivirgaceae bacterium]